MDSSKLLNSQALAIKPEIFISFYCRCLEFMLQNKITGDKEQLRLLIINTIEQNTEQGQQLHQVITLNDEEEKQIDNFSSEKGLIIVPILKLSQFISDAVKSTANNERALTENENAQLEMLLDIPSQQAFDIIFQASIQTFQQLQIANPLIFLLEHFSVIIGWLAGFFASLTNTSATEFLAKNNVALKEQPKVLLNS